jgi:hypothetical protein
MDQRLEAILADLERAPALPPADQARCARRAKWLAEASAPQMQEFLAVLHGQQALTPEADAILHVGLAAWIQQQRGQQSPAAKAGSDPHASDADGLLQEVVRLYGEWGPKSRARGQLLAWLAVRARRTDLQALARLLIDDPPTDEGDIVQALAPLFAPRSYDVSALFPELLAALSNPDLAAAVLDLANYLSRAGLVPRHVAAERQTELVALLGQMADSLGRLEERPTEMGDSAVELSRRVASSVALTVSLCDALALLGAAEAIPKLYRVLDLGHRRLRTEAAAALARLGEQRGSEELVKMAAEPIARLRALAYAVELNVLDKIDARHRTPEARAAAELTVWLAEPTQFGVPPTLCELFDRRRQFWPGFAEPVECFLLRFSYTITVEGEGERTYSNIGIAGPLVHAFTADLADLPPDDIYAAYAGWHAKHEEISEHDVARLSRSEQTEVVRLERRLHDAGYTNILPQQMGYFFGQRALTALAERDGLPGVVVADVDDTLFFPERGARRPLGAREAYSIYKGRQLLRSFNRGDAASS